MTSEPIALVTYSTKPRGGVVHTLSLAEALQARGVDVHLFTLGEEGRGFHRSTPVPYTVIPAPTGTTTLEEKVFASVDALEAGLAASAREYRILHTQDCISARAAARVRDERAGAGDTDVIVVRTVHHIDDFTTPALVRCQQQAVLEPDVVLTVSQDWRRRVQSDFGVIAQVVPNGVDPSRFPVSTRREVEALRAQVGAQDRFLFLAVGGIEPRKGSQYLFEALAQLERLTGRRPVLAIVGGHSFQDYEAYRIDALDRLADLGLREGVDVCSLGTVTDRELASWYRAADALAYPSVKEGFGLVVLEAMVCDLPVVTSNIPVFQEYLTNGVNALLARVSDANSLAEAMAVMMTSGDLRRHLIRGGRQLFPRFTWDESAASHVQIYEKVRGRLARSWIVGSVHG